LCQFNRGPCTNLWIFGWIWCPGVESNHRHRDFQSWNHADDEVVLDIDVAA
jgi:hypothetical protein